MWPSWVRILTPAASAFATNGRRKSANLKISKGGEAGKCIQVEKQLTDDEVTFGGLTAVELWIFPVVR